MAQVNRRRVVKSDNVVKLFNDTLSTRAKRSKVSTNVQLVSSSELEVFIDESVTFAVVRRNGQVFTGWSKFNASDQNYREVSGIAHAFQRAVDAMLGVR